MCELPDRGSNPAPTPGLGTLSLSHWTPREVPLDSILEYDFPHPILWHFKQKHKRRGASRGRGGKEHTCQCKRHKRCRFNPRVEKIPGGGNGNPLQYSYLENSMDRGASEPPEARGEVWDRFFLTSFQRNNPADISSVTSSLQNCEKINFCCFSLSVCGSLLPQN